MIVYPNKLFIEVADMQIVALLNLRQKKSETSQMMTKSSGSLKGGIHEYLSGRKKLTGQIVISSPRVIRYFRTEIFHLIKMARCRQQSPLTFVCI